MEYKVGNKVKLKKKHPCGSDLFIIRRVGIDFKFQCEGCNNLILIPREKALKLICKNII